MCCFPRLRARLQASAPLLLLILAATSHAWAWGCAGHQIIALIALRHLDPATQAAVNAILAADPLNPTSRRTCPASGLPPLAAAANWADAVRNGATAPEHYVNVPLPLSLLSPHAHQLYTQACADHCVSWAIDHYSQLLAADNQVSGKLRVHARAHVRADALRYLVHFVGDVHQPLHTLDDGDRGGNAIEVYLPGARRQTSLHAAWDTAFLATLQGSLHPETFAAQLDSQTARAVTASLPVNPQHPDDPETWAWESHALAARFAYRSLPPQGGDLSPAYVHQAQAIVASQLERAGLRLARLLQTLLAQSPATMAALSPSPLN